MSINKNYMQLTKNILTSAFVAVAIALFAMPTVTLAEYSYDYGGDTGYSDTFNTSDYYGYSTPSGSDTFNTSDYYGYSTPSGSDTFNTSDYYGYSTPTSSGTFNTSDYYGYSTPTYSYSTPSTGGCSSCQSSTPSYGYSIPSYTYSTPSYGGCTSNCHTSSPCTSNCGSSIPSYSYSTPSYGSNTQGQGQSQNQSSNATSNPTLTNTSNPTVTGTNTNNASTSVSSNNSNTNSAYSNPYTYQMTGYNASTSISSVNNNPNTNTNTNTTGASNSSASTSISISNPINNNNNSTAVNNASTTVNVVNNIVVNVPSSYAGPYNYYPPNNDNPGNTSLNGNCSINPSYNVAVGQDISFMASASGGNGNYSYSWSGSDGLNSSSQNFTGKFYSSGNKYVTVTITSAGQSITRSCNVNVTGSNTYLNVYCTATPTVATLNQYITWGAYATGGNGNYYYSWSGSDGLYGNGQTITKQYNNTGQKSATVTVTADGQNYTATCYSTVNAIYGYQTQASNVTLIKGTSDQINPVSGIYLNQVPATGISMSWKISLFAIGLLAWSVFAAVIVSKRRKFATAGSTADMVEAFKARNLAMKNR